MSILRDDPAWKSVADALSRHLSPDAKILAPAEFGALFSRTAYYPAARFHSPQEMDAFVIHKGRLEELGQPLCAWIAKNRRVLFANGVFVVYAKRGSNFISRADGHVAAFLDKLARPESFAPPPATRRSEFDGPATVVLMTTYNRPERLALSLQSISALGVPTLVVNDGSDAKHAAAYSVLTEKFGVRLLNIPGNRGLANAITTGLSYWLADPRVEWISYLQDDVEVRSDLLTALARVQDPDKFPLLTGRVPHEIEIAEETEVNGEKVLLRRTAPGTHLHAHRSYWEKILPIPTFHFQSPKHWAGEPPQGSGADWWVVQWSPHSAGQQGKFIAVLPGLVRTCTVLPEESTWDNPSPADPPLPPARYAPGAALPHSSSMPGQFQEKP